MSILELGAIGEFLGSIGVIATLVYLAIQIRQNTRSMEVSQRIAMAENYVARVNQIEQSLRSLATSNDLADIVVRGDEQGAASLTAAEARRYRSFYLAQFHRIDSQFYQLQQQLLDAESRAAFENIVLRVARRWKELNTFDMARPSFKAEVERILRQQDDSAASKLEMGGAR